MQQRTCLEVLREAADCNPFERIALIAVSENTCLFKKEKRSSLKHKIDIMEESEKYHLSSRKLAEQFGVGKTQINDILKNKSDIKRMYEEALPDSNELSGEDSADEENIGLLENISGKQLQAQAEAVTISGRVVEGNNICEVGSKNTRSSASEESSDEVMNWRLSHFVSRSSSKKKNTLEWRKNEDLLETHQNFPESDFSHLSNLNSVNIVERFIDDDIVNFLVAGSTKWALYINCPDPKITFNEMEF
ncbi:homeobox-like domain superfamily [Holotrichia oblita]|uniref:Homeobox-like domain superfamily n=1 Tax=Holotrichia oblita TaxID=644536 RepID=A0ACB9SL83_HOLOL|nr:homeobox-like domain superfamily [Holotrichia oblita]